MSNLFYITVSKNNSGNFEINEDDNDPNNTSSDPPNSAISGDVPFKVQVNVTTGNSTTDKNSFPLNNGRIYTLVLDSVATATNATTKIRDVASFKAAVPVADAAVAADAAVPADAAVSQGGQKQKQQKSKRNYSKKRRSFKSKSDTLRNYFNYDHLQ